MSKPFWKSKPMSQMSVSEWESLCDGCGKCCLLRMEDEETQAVYVTDVHCKLFDGASCRCKDYKQRKKTVPDCVQLTPDNVTALGWMPMTCAYRLIANGQDLPDWHHLVSGSKDTIHKTGWSVQGLTVHEDTVCEDDLQYRITIWPGEPDIK